MAACAGAILIVEDSVDDVKAVQEVLEKAGIENPVGTVHGVTDAIASLSRTIPFDEDPPISVILLDLKLPGKDGFCLLDWLKNHAEFNNVLTIVISGLGDLASIRRAYALGADSFLTKPCTLPDLQNLIEWFPEYWKRSPFAVLRASREHSVEHT